MKTLAIFGGSKELSRENSQELDLFLQDLFSHIQGKVGNIIYGGWQVGVMGQVLNACKQYDMPITGYILEKHKRPTSLTDVRYFENHIDQVNGFVRNSDMLLALPGGFGTLREILHANESLKDMKLQKPIYVPSIFRGFHTMLAELMTDNMVADEDMGNIIELKRIDVL